RAWPAEERPRERLYHKGAAALSDGELLAIQLGTGIQGMSALDVAHALLAQFGTLQEVAGRDVAEVAAVRGVGRAKAVRLASAFEITRRLRSRNGHARPVLGGPAQGARPTPGPSSGAPSRSSPATLRSWRISERRSSVSRSSTRRMAS